MEIMAKRMEEKERRVAGGKISTNRGIPFTESIKKEELPRDFKSPNILLYDGTTDSEDHLYTFRNYALLHRYSDAIMCKVFLITFAKAAMQWFNELPEKSIGSFAEFSSKFIHQFASSKRHEKTSLSLFNIKQGGSETLRAYVKRFNAAILEVPSATPDLKTSAFTRGLKEGDLFKSLIKKPARGYDELLSRTEKYINVEEAQVTRRSEQDGHKKEKLEDDSHGKRYKEGRGIEASNPAPMDPSGIGRMRKAERIPLRGNRSEHLKTLEVMNVLQWPKGVNKAPTKLPSNLFCRYHREYGHDTDECRALIDEIQRLVKIGYLEEYVIDSKNRIN